MHIRPNKFFFSLPYVVVNAWGGGRKHSLCRRTLRRQTVYRLSIEEAFHCMQYSECTCVTLRGYEFILSPQISLENRIVTDNIYVHKNNYYTADKNTMMTYILQP